MSVRNIDADLAASKLNELFHLHRYDDCVLFVNRLSPLALLHLLPNLPIDAYLSRLPYTIELFEALYAKVFIHDPDQFPARTLQPERLIDKMVAYFSILHVNSNSDDLDQIGFLEPIDGAKMLDSFENVIRVISYVQPQQYPRLLYFKYAIDRALLRFDRDLVAFGRNLASLNEYLLANQTISSGFHHKSSSKRPRSATNNYANALLISRASNLQSCEAMRVELEKSISNCQKAHLKLNEYISHLKSQKLSKNLQSIVFGQQNGRELSPSPNDNSPTTTSSKSATLNNKKNKQKERKASASTERVSEGKSKRAAPRSESVSNFKPQSAVQSQSSVNGPTSNDTETPNGTLSESFTLPNLKKSTSTLVIGTATICQDFIQNRLYLNKAMMNSVEPFVESIKLQQLLNSLYEKIDLDKEILLVYTHIKREEPYLNSLEPLQPLFKRYSLGFERCIQIWRKKCSADSLLLCNSVDPMLALPDQQLIISNPSSPLKPAQSTEKSIKSKSIDTDASIYNLSPSKNALKHNKQSNGAALSAASSSLAAAIASSAIQNGHSPKTAIVSSNISINYSTTNAVNDEEGQEQSVKHQKYFSEVNLFTSPLSENSGYNTLPGKFRAPKKLETQLTQEVSESVPKGAEKSPTVETKSVETQTVPTENNTESKSDSNLLSEIERLNGELNKANNMIVKLKEQNEKVIREEDESPKLGDQEEMKQKVAHKSTSGDQEFQNYQFTYDLIHLYNNLNHKYRAEAFESLNLSNSDTSNVCEFKIKLLFSVIVLAYRYVKTYIRDLKRRVRSVLQIQDRSASTERSSSQKSQTPTIVIQRADDSSNQPISKQNSQADGVDSPSQVHKRPSLAHLSKFNNVSLGPNSIENEQQASIRSIEKALDLYFQASSLGNSFDLHKITEEVKQQLWTTLSEYPQLKDCHELNSFINESVKTSWALANHQPAFRLDYSSSKYNGNMHERADGSTVQNEQILNYVWPALIDSSDNSCLSKGIVMT